MQNYSMGIKPAGAKLDNYGNPIDNPFCPVVPTTEDQASKIYEPSPEIIAVPPPHMEAPRGAETLDIRRAVVLTPGSIDVEIISFTCPEGANVWINQYAVYNDGSDASLIDFKPLVDGRRVIGYHGDPNDNYKINLAIVDNLSDIALIRCQIILSPNQTFRWLATNNDINNLSFGVRMRGYFDFSGKISAGKMGG
jgi:hypothetical protein